MRCSESSAQREIYGTNCIHEERSRNEIDSLTWQRYGVKEQQTNTQSKEKEVIKSKAEVSEKENNNNNKTKKKQQT